MVIAVGSDHAGFELKEFLKLYLAEGGHRVLDMGTISPASTDYPDYAELVARAVSTGEAERGILVCGTGVGMAMAANKVPGVRAAFCPDLFTARMSREHNDANVLTLGARITAREFAREILDLWLTTKFSGGERHVRRIEKIHAIDRRWRRER